MNIPNIKFKQQKTHNNLRENGYLQKEGEVSLDLSQRGLEDISNDVLLKCRNLQYLYLEGNKLIELNKEFFPSLKQLKWLDVRNNQLTTLPNSIAEHPSLQVLLLEGNKIKALPEEIGSLPSLRGIQLTRNPIVYPPPTVINQGVQSTIEFLRKQWQQLQSPQHIQLETHSQSKTLSPKRKPSVIRKQKAGACKSAVILKINSHKPYKHRKVQSGLCTTSLSKCISVRPISHRKHQASINNWNIENDSDKIFHPMSFDRNLSTHDQRRRKTLPSHNVKLNRKLAEEEVQPKFLRDIWIEKIRHILLTQETIIQRRKNAKALKEWQDETKALQQDQRERESKPDIDFPYDSDPDYLKILSRKDLASSVDQKKRDSSLHHLRHQEPINSSILSIIAALRELQMSQPATSVSPRSEQKVLAQEIKKIKDIQRSLDALKLKNFGQLGLSL